MCGVDVFLGLREWLLGGFIDGEKIKLRAIALVKEQLVANTLNDDVPGLDATGCTHECGQDGVSGEDRGRVILGKAADDGVVSGGDLEEVPRLEALEATLRPGSDAVIGPVVELDCATDEEILGLGHESLEKEEKGICSFTDHSGWMSTDGLADEEEGPPRLNWWFVWQFCC